MGYLPSPRVANTLPLFLLHYSILKPENIATPLQEKPGRSYVFAYSSIVFPPAFMAIWGKILTFKIG